MDARVFWGWITKGLNGCLAIVANMAKDTPPITEHFLGELKKARDFLDDLIQKLEAKT